MKEQLYLKSLRELFCVRPSNPSRLPCAAFPGVNKENLFFIPSFQRGYRWSELQVEQLFKDLLDFHKNLASTSSDWYCLQPLVVVEGKENQSKGKWVVIDGQQRLTTLFLMLKLLGVFKNQDGNGLDKKVIGYETRDGSGSWDFLRHLGANQQEDDNQKNNNPDFFFMYQAWKTMEKCLKQWLEGFPEHENDEKEKFSTTILDYAKVIWYETRGDPYEEFNRLNSGKISLSNAELMKALLLKEPLRDGKRELSQLEAAQEWDMMEHSLRDDDFWCFINPSPTDKRFDATRLDFIFELVLRMNEQDNKYLKSYWEKHHDNEQGTGAIKLIDALQKNPYFSFGVFQSYCENSGGAIAIWHDVQGVFRRIRSWFVDRELFHRIGYLMNRKGPDPEQKLQELAVWLADAQESTKSQMRTSFESQIKKSISHPLMSLEYGKDNLELYNILLLFNIAIILRQRQEISRYPFREHKYAAWTLEHIHAKQERELNLQDMKKIAKLLGLEIDGADGAAYMKAINLKFETACEKDAKEDSATRIIEAGDKAWRLIDHKDTHGLENLALLGHRANSTFNNSLYLEKREILSHWLKGDYEQTEPNSDTGVNAEKQTGMGFEKVEFVPRATVMTFFKQFSPEITYPFLWTEDDAKNYLDAIVKTLSVTFKFPSIDL
jgi:hypothetical protein